METRRLKNWRRRTKREREKRRKRRVSLFQRDNSLRSTCNDSRLSRADLVVVDLLEPINYLGSGRGGGRRRGEGSVARVAVEKGGGGGGGGGWDTGGKRHLE